MIIILLITVAAIGIYNTCGHNIFTQLISVGYSHFLQYNYGMMWCYWDEYDCVKNFYSQIQWWLGTETTWLGDSVDFTALTLGPRSYSTAFLLQHCDWRAWWWFTCKEVLQIQIHCMWIQAGYYRVDHDYIINSARLAKQGGCSQFHLVSSMGANEDSILLAVRVKVCRSLQKRLLLMFLYSN